MEKNVEILIDIVFSDTASISDKDDAVMFLGEIGDNKKAEMALISIASDKSQPSILAASAGEALSLIWKSRGHIDKTIFENLVPEAKAEVKAICAEHILGNKDG